MLGKEGKTRPQTHENQRPSSLCGRPKMLKMGEHEAEKPGRRRSTGGWPIRPGWPEGRAEGWSGVASKRASQKGHPHLPTGTAFSTARQQARDRDASTIEGKSGRGEEKTANASGASQQRDQRGRRHRKSRRTRERWTVQREAAASASVRSG